MKTYPKLTKFLLAAFALAFVCLASFAGDGNPPPDVGGHADQIAAAVPHEAGGLEKMIVSIATPLLIALARWLAPRVPKPIIPIAAGLLGFLLDQVLPWVGLQSTGYGFLLGLAGVGLREMKKQVTDAAKAAV